MSKIYKLLEGGEKVESSIPGEYAGWNGGRKGKIFGTLDCKSGMRMDKENRVFFLNLETAVTEGYRPCKNCRPINEEDFEQIAHLIPERTLEEFYDRGSKK
jgi:methylphosphotriester-DNA--protein-cysteine methyltransferase